MKEGNITNLADKMWSDLIPSTRVFLTSVVLFLLLALLVMFVVLLFFKILHTLWPRVPRINFRPSSSGLRKSDVNTGECNESDRNKTELKVRFRGSDRQDERESQGHNEGSISPVGLRSAAPSPALSPLNPFSANYCPDTPRRPVLPYTASHQTSHPASFGLRKPKIPDTFSGKTDLEDWIRHFEIISRWNGWNEQEMGSSLASSLRGSAQQVLRDLPAVEMEDYHSILRALKRRFDPEEREGLHKDFFETRFKEKEESSTEYGFALSRIAASAYPRMSRKDREEIVIDQFISGLPSRELQKFVKFGNPRTLDKAIALATEYEGFERIYSF